MTKARNISILNTVEAGATADQTKADIEGLGIAASSITGALPAIDGSALTGVGKVIGYSHQTLGTGVNLSSFNPSSYGTPAAIPNATITYTPVSTTSKILVMNDTYMLTNNNGNTSWFYLGLDLYYNYSVSSPTASTSLFERNDILAHDFSGSTSGIWQRNSSHFSYLHDHNTPSGESITYKMYWDTDNASSATFGTLKLNQGNNIGTFTIIELEG